MGGIGCCDSRAKLGFLIGLLVVELFSMTCVVLLLSMT